MARLNNQAIIILGMHRSGTSAFTRVLNLLGVELSDAMMPAMEDNEGGFWEHVEIVDLHDRLLHAFSSSWDDVCRLPEKWWLDPRVEVFREEITAILLRDFSNSPMWGLKDPRLCRLLPLWIPLLDQLGCKTFFPFVSRNPFEIAGSLEKRNSFAQSKTLLLWLEYTLAAERDTRGKSRVFISYDEYLADWEATMNRVARSLGIAWPRGCAEIMAEVRGFLDPGKKHHRAARAANAEFAWVESANRAMSLLVAGEESHARTMLDPINASLDQAQALFVPQIRSRGNELQKQIDELHARFTWQISQLEYRNRALEKKAAKAGERQLKAQERLQKTEAKLAKADDELRQIKKSAAWTISKPVRAVEKIFAGSKPKAPAETRNKKNPSAKRATSDSPNEKISEKKLAQEKSGISTQNISAKELLSAANLAALQSFLASGAKLALPQTIKPEVSILLVLYNRAELTFACLCSLLAIREIACEVVIVDNHSTDETPALLRRLTGATIISNSENAHFLEGCNQAAREAKGRHFLFLNNDTQLLPGSLESALRTLRSCANIGAVGAKLILPDGALQEAGSVVWQDGSCLGYGRGGNPNEPEFQFQRDVDFCSGAFLLTPREFFLENGGFDDRFKPAYYEETDYCLRLWEKGLRVVYDPNAVVLHYEFASSQKSQDAIDLQARNQRIFAERHAALLMNQRPFSTENILRSRSHHRGGARVLFIEDRVPHAHFGSGYPRAREIARSLVELAHFVTVFPMLKKEDDDWPSVYETLPRETEVMLGYGSKRLEEFLHARQGFYDFVLVSRPHNMKQVQAMFAADPELLGRARLVYDAEAIFAMREITQKRLQGSEVSEAERTALIESEMQFVKGASAVLTVSDNERAIFEKHTGVPCFTLSHTAHIAPTPASFVQRNGILFVGAVYTDDSPNGDSVLWFENAILPILRARHPINVTVVGHNESERIASLNRAGFRVAGPVPDVTSFYNHARVFIAPTRFAAGIPLKVHEATARGLPTVCTSLLAQQLGWRDGVELLVADDPESFAAKCIELHENETLWLSIRANALKRLEAECSKEVFLAKLREVFSKNAASAATTPV